MFELQFSKEVELAKLDDAPIVALESTIITHGMPYPQNLETAHAVEDEVRKMGAIPATIAVMDGIIHIGLEADMLKALAQAKSVAKLSRADLPVIVSEGKTGATTVAATMILANLAGISVFATGGIGGVHHDASESFDISADLHELSKTSVTVVGAGAKAILDIPKTLEILETLGVPVIAYGQDALPAFWSRESVVDAPLRMDDPTAIARAHLTRVVMGLSGGQLIGNPIPKEHEIPRSTIMPLIRKAQEEAEANSITGKDVTPFLLQRIFELTDGASLTANIALVKNNARLASEIAIALKKLA